MADARSRNFKQCEKALAEEKTQREAVTKRLETSDALRRQKQITIEEMQTTGRGGGQGCEGLQMQYNECEGARGAAESQLLEASKNASECGAALAAHAPQLAAVQVELELCARRAEASGGAAEEVRAMLYMHAHMHTYTHIHIHT